MTIPSSTASPSVSSQNLTPPGSAPASAGSSPRFGSASPEIKAKIQELSAIEKFLDDDALVLEIGRIQNTSKVPLQTISIAAKKLVEEVAQIGPQSLFRRICDLANSPEKFSNPPK